jgi:hypothetical protein
LLLVIDSTQKQNSVAVCDVVVVMAHRLFFDFVINAKTWPAGQRWHRLHETTEADDTR